MTTAQLTFEHLRAQQAPPRVAGPGARAYARAEQQAVIDAAATGFNPAREAEVERIRCELHRYITQLGVGSEFQASDFITRLHAIGCPPNEEVIDPRCTGGMFVRLVHQNVLSSIGHRVNAGNKHTGYGSTCRPVYRIEKLPPASVQEAA